MAKLSELTQVTDTDTGDEIYLLRDGGSRKGKLHSLASFLQSGTGAVARSIQSKLREVVSVTDFGAVAGGVTDCTTAITNAIAALGSSGGIVYFPPGLYRVSSTISIGGASTSNVTLQGAGRGASYISAVGAGGATDCVVVSVGSSGMCFVKDLTIYGKGVNNDTGTFGATQNAVEFGGSLGGGMQNVQIIGGYYPLKVTAIDALFINVETGFPFGPANVYINGASWFYHCKWDQAATTVAASAAPPYSARANTTLYAAGDSVTLSGYVLTCITGGTSGGSAPSLKNYVLNITDGTVVWMLAGPATYYGVHLDTSSGENHFDMVDLSGTVYTNSVYCDAGVSGYTYFHHGVVSNPIAVQSGAQFFMNATEIGASAHITVNTAYAGKLQLQGLLVVTGSLNITIGAGVDNFIIANNQLGGGTITVAAGDSDNYQIVNNVQATVSDGGTGNSKTVVNNGAMTGTNTNDSAAAGKIGEIISSAVETGSAVALTTATPANVTSIALTAGDWEVTGIVHLKGNAATTFTNGFCSVSGTSATLSDTAANCTQMWGNGNTIFASATYVSFPLVSRRVTIAATTTHYLVTNCVFGVNTCSAFGYLKARRVR